MNDNLEILEATIERTRACIHHENCQQVFDPAPAVQQPSLRQQPLRSIKHGGYILGAMHEIALRYNTTEKPVIRRYAGVFLRIFPVHTNLRFDLIPTIISYIQKCNSVVFQFLPVINIVNSMIHDAYWRGNRSFAGDKSI